MTIRVDFYGRQKETMFTASFPDAAAATTMIEEVLVYDIYNPNGPYSMTIWDTTSGNDTEVHTYMLQEIPEGTANAFEKANTLYPKTANVSKKDA